jgi:hypothetical protein
MNGGAGGHRADVTDDHPRGASAPSPDLVTTISEIRYWHHQRVFAMDQRKRADLALGAFLRGVLGWSRSLPKAEAEAINRRAADLIETGERMLKQKQGRPIRKTVNGADPLYQEWASFIEGCLNGRAHYVAIEDKAVAEMERLAALLPVASWFNANVFSSSFVSLAVIIAETGDLSGYANPGKVWKRMGLAVMNGVRQGGLRKTASKDEWIAHGYSAKRRSFMFVIGDVLVKKQGYLREVYLGEKQKQRTKAVAAGLTVAPAAKIPEKRKAEFISDGHIHKMSQRYMEKRLLKNLWQAWRRATPNLETSELVPAAKIEPQAVSLVNSIGGLPVERSARLVQPTIQNVPSASIPARAGKRRARIDANSNVPVPAANLSPTT